MTTKVLTLFGEEVEVHDHEVPVRRAPAKKEKKQKPPPAPKVVKEKKEKQPRELKQTDALSNWAADKQYYTIGEVASLFSVRTSNIRFWTKEFEMKVRTTRKGDRLYTPEQVREINTIYHLVKERGFTITGAKAKLKVNKKTVGESVDLKKSLTQLRSKLLQIRNKLS
ncbi:MAG: MerR family transcriptional regulator [Bacteroidetes bacterium]|nr:MerR family transcriptional regulator [Bacteroidota bacterium]